MNTRSLKAAPSLIVLAVTGYVAWPLLYGTANPAPSAGATKPPPDPVPAVAAENASLRSPFQISKARQGAEAEKVASTAPKVETKEKAANIAREDAEKVASTMAREKAKVAMEDERALAGMKLDGTMIDRRQRFAVIDGKVYAQGESLKGPDGAALGYVVKEVHPYRAVIHRGGRDFVLAFSDPPATKAKGEVADAKSKSKSNPGLQARRGNASRPANGTRPGAPAGPDDGAMRNAAATLGGLAPKAGSNPAAQQDTGAAEQVKQAILGLLPGDKSALSAGLDALLGKYDNIGNGVATPGGGTP